MPDKSSTREQFLKLIEQQVRKEESAAAKKEFLDMAKPIFELFKQMKAMTEQERQSLSQFLQQSLKEIETRVNAIIKGKDGLDGRNGKDGADGVDGATGPKGKDGINGRDGSPDTPKQVRDKLQSLSEDERLDAKFIKGLDEVERRIMKRFNNVPRPHGVPAVHPMKFYDLSSQTNGSLKLFTVPKNVHAVVFTSDFPYVLIEGNGFTMDKSRTQLTLTVANAPSAGAQLLFQYSSLFNTTT